MVYGSELPSHLGGNLEQLFSTTPLGLIGAGNFSVCIFFVLSGYVLTQKYFKIRDDSIIISGALRRYIRLFIPVFAAVMLSFLLASAGLYRYYIETMMISAGSNYRGYWTFTPDIFDAVKQAGWNSFFLGGNIYYNPVLWTMTIEFYGSMLVFTMALLFGSLKNRWTFYLAAAVLLLNSYYLAFVIGMALADVFNNKTPVLQVFKTGNKIVLFIILVSGLFIGSYPISPLTNDSLYTFLNNGFFETPKVTYHIIGAGMVIYVLLNSQGLQNVFSSQVPVFLGKVSYSLYLIHFLVISSFTCASFLFLYPVLSYGAAVLISCALSLLLIIPLSYLFYKYIDLAGVEISKVFYKRVVNSRTSEGAGNIKQESTSSAIFSLYNKLFK
jgi:peptidoglycan/LPS O-acetylase OafA/YrhL